MRFLKIFLPIAALAIFAIAGIAYFYGFENARNFAASKISKTKSVEEAAEIYTLGEDAVGAQKIEYGDKLEILALKHERMLYVFAAKKDAPDKLALARKYPFKGFSGKLGPKLREGDLQIPEGVYGVDFLNPNSRFHLSFRVSYPNEFDRKMARADGRGTSKLGGDIMIHGGSATVGCIPIGNAEIEELFAWVATVKKENVKIVIAPKNLLLANSSATIKSSEVPQWYSTLLKSIKDEQENMRRRGANF